MRTRVIEIKSDLKESRAAPDRKTVIRDILTNDQVRPEEKETEYLRWECQTLIAAGTLTTSHMLSILTFYILSNPEILERLQKELRSVMPDAESKPTWVELEKLPYMVGALHLPIFYSVSII